MSLMCLEQWCGKRTLTYACGSHLLGVSFLCRLRSSVFVNVCAPFNPHPYSAVVWSLPDVFCGGVVFGPWWRPRVPSTLFFPPLLSPLTHFLPPSYCLFSFCYPVSPLFLPLPIVTKSFSSSLQTFTPDPSSITPEVFPGKSWPFPTAHRECLGLLDDPLSSSSLNFPIRGDRCCWKVCWSLRIIKSNICPIVTLPIHSPDEYSYRPPLLLHLPRQHFFVTVPVLIRRSSVYPHHTLNALMG